jgi:hypothetical protein
MAERTRRGHRRSHKGLANSTQRGYHGTSFRELRSHLDPDTNKSGLPVG